MPETLLSSRTLALLPPPVNAPMLPMSVPSSVSMSELSANLIAPLIVAPLSTTMLSQPFSPSD